MSGLRAEIGLAIALGLFVQGAYAQAPPPAQTPPTTTPSALPSVERHVTRPNTPIEVSKLGAPEGPALGLLDSANGGLGSEIWSGSPRAKIEDLVARLPLGTPVRSVRSLGRRLLLTTADAPVGQAPHAFQTVRIEALLNAGMTSDAAKLASLIELKDDPEFTRIQTEAILLGGGPQEACGTATAARDTDPDPFWLELRAYCYALGGQNDLLDLTRGVMKAQGSDDKAFEILLDDAISHKATPPGEVHSPSAVDVFLMRQVGLPIGPNFAARFGLPASVLALRDARNSPTARADAAAQALNAGAASTTELDAVADVQSFTPQQLANAETAAEGLPFFLGQALIHQRLAHETDNDTKAKLLAVAFRLARQAGLLPIAALMQQSAAQSVVPSPATRAFVRPFAQALLLAGRADAAERWREALNVNVDADKPLAAALAIELNLVAPNPGREARAEEALVWIAQNLTVQQPIGGPEELRYEVLTMGLYAQLNEPVPQGLPLQTLLAQDSSGRTIAPVARKRLEEADGKPELKGEAILTVLDTVGAGGPGDLSPGAASFLTHILMSEGETDAARAFAIDCLLLFKRASPT